MINAISQEVLTRFRHAISQRFGLECERQSNDELARTLTVLLTSSDVPDPTSYLVRLETDTLTIADLQALAAALSVGETYFFRHADQFRVLTELAVRNRLETNASTKRISFLSAGCSSGEEAYSLAIVASEFKSELAEWRIEIDGVDMNPVHLLRARQARYTSWSLRGVTDGICQRYFRPDKKEFLLDESIRSMVRFSERNLLDDERQFWQPSRFDIIFFRNVMMYLTPDASRKVIGKIAESLAPGGFLFLGPAENLRGISQQFHLRNTHGTFYYQRRDSRELCSGTVSVPTSPGQSDSIPEGIDESWVAAIHHAGERIEKLIARSSTAKSPGFATASNRDSSPTSPFDVEVLATLTTARAYLQQDRLDDALSTLQELPPDGVSDPDVLLLRAALLTNRGAVKEARQLCESVLTGDALNAEAHYLLALCHEHEGDFATAAQHDHTAIYLAPDFAMPHLHLGLLAKRNRVNEAAIEAFRVAEQLLPREESSRILLFGGGFPRNSLIDLCKAELRELKGVL